MKPSSRETRATSGTYMRFFLIPSRKECTLTGVIAGNKVRPLTLIQTICQDHHLHCVFKVMIIDYGVYTVNFERNYSQGGKYR